MGEKVLSISLDPAFAGCVPGLGKALDYVDEVNSWADVTIHLDIMRAENVGHNRVTEAEKAYVLSHAKHPVDVHVVTREAVQWLDDTTVVVMFVEPGESGRPFNQGALVTLGEVRKNHPTARIIADGGITAENIAAVAGAGADVLVVGSFIGKGRGRKERAQTVQDLLGILRKQS